MAFRATTKKLCFAVMLCSAIALISYTAIAVANPGTNRPPIASFETTPFPNMFHRVACRAEASRNCKSICSNVHRDDEFVKSVCHNACVEKYGC